MPMISAICKLSGFYKNNFQGEHFMRFKSSRGNPEKITGARAILRGIAPDRGLYVPTEFPVLPFSGFNEIAELPYRVTAERVIGSFFNDYSEEEIKDCVSRAYSPSNFSVPEIAPLHKAGDVWFMELYHGRTSAFKDMALSVLPYLLTSAMRKEHEDCKICILTATSGDTGKAALQGFADVPGTEICVFYPAGGVSAVQRLQMTTQEGGNVHVFAIRGNFDDAQTHVKDLFEDREFGKELLDSGIRLSSANSINIGRLVPQVAYYVFAYGQMIKQGAVESGQPVNFVVPTGNFGNILAAYYAYRMGIPVNRLICASNKNKILTDFLNSGEYDTHREFYTTNSPSMDILVSSNLERLIYHLCCGDTEQTATLMNELETEGEYIVPDNIRDGLKLFYGGFCNVEDTETAIGGMFRENGYLMDTHTAVAYKVYRDYVSDTGDLTPSVIASTASPYKFASSVLNAIRSACIRPEETDSFTKEQEPPSDINRSAHDAAASAGAFCDGSYPHEPVGIRAIEELNEITGVPVPEGLKGLDRKPVLHDTVIGPGEMRNAVFTALRV